MQRSEGVEASHGSPQIMIVFYFILLGIDFHEHVAMWRAGQLNFTRKRLPQTANNVLDAAATAMTAWHAGIVAR